MVFEDFQIGQTFSSEPQTLTRERIIEFGEEFDPQPAHLSDELAAASQFGELIASGWHTACVAMRLTYDACFARIEGGGMGAGVEKLTWIRTVRPGDALHAVVEVTEKRESRSRPDKGIINFLTTAFNQDGERVLTMLATVIVPRRNRT